MANNSHPFLELSDGRLFIQLAREKEVVKPNKNQYDSLQSDKLVRHSFPVICATGTPNADELT